MKIKPFLRIFHPISLYFHDKLVAYDEKMERCRVKATLFVREFLLNPRTIGAILPSSDYLAEKMMASVCFEQAKYIIEYGPGTGVFTDKILRYRHPDTVVMIIEHNREFFCILNEKYQDEKNVIIINGSAEHIETYVKEHNIPFVDYIISGLPFASLPLHVSNAILNKARYLLGVKGKFITFQYTQTKVRLFTQFFNQMTVERVYRNLPPAFVFSCYNEK
jgi:phospholipid N-methyltransferase